MTTVETQRQIPFPILRSLVEIYYDFQHQRIITSNRIFGNVEQHNISEESLQEYGVADLLKKAESFEKDVKKLLTKEMPKYQIYNDYLIKIMGIGPTLSAGLLAHIEDITKFDNISKLRQYAGFGMNAYCSKCKKPAFFMAEFKKRDGKVTKVKRLSPMKNCPICGEKTKDIIQRRIQGYQGNWNNKFKVLCWKISGSFVKQKAFKKDGKTINSGYRLLYDQFKEEELRKHPKQIKNEEGKIQFNKGHINDRALRRVVKLFLSHLWIVWRTQRNLSITSPYEKGILGHDIIEPFIDVPNFRKVFSTPFFKE